MLELGLFISGSIGWRPGDVTALDRIQKKAKEYRSCVPNHV